MITALISSVVGIVGGLIPDIFKEIRESREHNRELERMDKSAELQMQLVDAQTDAKMAEIDGNILVEEMRGFAKQMENIYSAQKHTSIKFVDGFNALIRPTTASLIMIMFVATASFYIYGAVQLMMSGHIGIFEASEMIWGSMVGEAIQAVLGFLFGYRSTKSATKRLARR